MSETKINSNQLRDGGSGSGDNIDYVLSTSGITGERSNLNGFVGGENKYLKVNNLISTENYDKWEIYITYTHGYSIYSFNGIISQYQTDYSGLTLHVRQNNQLQLNLKNEGNSWIIADEYLNLTVVKGVTYYMKIVYDSSKSSNQYSFYYKYAPNDNWINSWNYTNSSKNYQSELFCLIGNGNPSAYYMRSNVSILNDFKFIGDGVTIFDLQTAVAGTDYENVGCFHNTENKTIWFL